MAVKLRKGQLVKLGDVAYKRHYGGVTEVITKREEPITLSSSTGRPIRSSASKINMMTLALR